MEFPRPGAHPLADPCLLDFAVVEVALQRPEAGDGSELKVDADPHNGLDRTSSVQCQHVRVVPSGRLGGPLGNVGQTSLAQVREVLGLILDVPA